LFKPWKHAFKQFKCPHPRCVKSFCWNSVQTTFTKILSLLIFGHKLLHRFLWTLMWKTSTKSCWVVLIFIHACIIPQISGLYLVQSLDYGLYHHHDTSLSKLRLGSNKHTWGGGGHATLPCWCHSAIPHNNVFPIRKMKTESPPVLGKTTNQMNFSPYV
jgi:hypothetical protein